MAAFSDSQIAALTRVMPFLALAIKAVALARMTGTLMETYLGRDAGQRVLSGRIMRGVADRIDAVIWFSDLRGFTRITDSAPEQVIPLLNDYADVIVSAIHGHGGDVLKLIGDGTLAIFAAHDRAQACDAALSTATAALQGVTRLNVQRAAEGLPVTEMYLGLHVGEVFYGNVGSTERLDFTVRRSRRQRGEPDRGDVPIGRSAGSRIGSLRQCRWRPGPDRLGGPICIAGSRQGPGALHAGTGRVRARKRCRLNRDCALGVCLVAATAGRTRSMLYNRHKHDGMQAADHDDLGPERSCRWMPTPTAVRPSPSRIARRC